MASQLDSRSSEVAVLVVRAEQRVVVDRVEGEQSRQRQQDDCAA
ncbi:MAG: hypothetical protein U0R24_10140 [Solirubrobacterales bacterium]